MDDDDLVALALGLAAGLGVYVVFGLCGMLTTDREQASPRTYSEFQGRFCAFKARLAGAWAAHTGCSASAGSPVCTCPGVLVALVEAQSQVCHIESLLTKRDARWVRVIGYVVLWQTLHDAEEALIEASNPDAVAAGLLDEMRLEGSNFTRHEELIDRIRLALPVVSPEAAPYLIKPAPTAPTSPTDIPTARVVLRDVRDSFNTWQDDRYGALARTRNNLYRQVTWVAMAVYIMLVLAILATGDHDHEAIQAGVSFVAIGGIVGLMSSWTGEKTSDKTVEDFGLARAELFQTFVLSGVAGFIGAVLYLVAPALVGFDLTPADADTSPTPAAGASASPSASATPTPSPTASPTPTPSPSPIPPVAPVSAGESGNPAALRVRASHSDVVSGSKVGAVISQATPASADAGCPEPEAGKTPALRCVFRLDGGSILIAWAVAAAFGLAPDRLFRLLNKQTSQLKADIQSAKAPEAAHPHF